MKTTILEFTLNNRKHTFYRRTDVYGEPLITTNPNSARKIKKEDIKNIIKKLKLKYGLNNIKDIKCIEDETKT